MENLLNDIIDGKAEATPFKKIGRPDKKGYLIFIKDGFLAVFVERISKNSKDGDLKPGTRWGGKDAKEFKEIVKAARDELGSDIGSAGLFCAVKGTGCCRQAAWRLENQVAPAAVTYKVDGVLWDGSNYKKVDNYEKGTENATPAVCDTRKPPTDKLDDGVVLA